MESKKNFSGDEDNDETLVTPRFDRGEAETAQPVVPLAVVSGEAETYDMHDARRASPSRVMRLKSWPLALILVSALAGGVLGGAGLYLFQQSREEAAAAPAERQTDTEAQVIAPAVETTPEPSPTPAEGVAALPAELPEQVAEVPAAVEEAEDREDADTKREESRRDDDDAAPRERSPAAEAPVKRGKKGDRDEEDNRGRESRPRRVADEYPRDSPSDDDDDEYNDRREARRVGSIVYGGEGRRERRRQRRQSGVDRVRGIFEGQP
jgi:type IV secretory pathway VirB10-like protein